MPRCIVLYAGVHPRRLRRRSPPDASGVSMVLGSGSVTTLRQIGEPGGLVRDRHGLDEMLLEQGLDGGLDLLDPPHHLLDLIARLRIEKRDARTGAGGVAG